MDQLLSTTTGIYFVSSFPNASDGENALANTDVRGASFTPVGKTPSPCACVHRTVCRQQSSCIKFDCLLRQLFGLPSLRRMVAFGPLIAWLVSAAPSPAPCCCWPPPAGVMARWRCASPISRCLRWPHALEWAAIIFNAVIVFGFAHVVWFRLARTLPPIASSPHISRYCTV